MLSVQKEIDKYLLEVGKKISTIYLLVDKRIINDKDMELEKLKNPSFIRRIFNWVANFFTGINETSEEKRREKEIRAKRLLLLIPAGIILIGVGAILFKKNYISTIVHVFSDTISVILIVIGILNLARLLLFRKGDKSII